MNPKDEDSALNQGIFINALSHLKIEVRIDFYGPALEPTQAPYLGRAPSCETGTVLDNLLYDSCVVKRNLSKILKI